MAQTIYCGFCGKANYEVRVLAVLDRHTICNECVSFLSDAIEAEELRRYDVSFAPWFDPSHPINL